jgi:E3 ubiquitin-protein ligase HUWE1
LSLLADDAEEANRKFRNLVVLHIRITLLSDVFATAGQAQGRAAIGLLQTLMSNTPLHVLTNLGALHRVSIWENIALNVGLSSKGIDTQSSPISSPLESPNHTTIDLPASDVPVAANGPSVANGAQPMDGFPLNPAPSAVKSDDPRNWNASSLKHITQGLPNALAPFFQGNFFFNLRYFLFIFLCSESNGKNVSRSKKPRPCAEETNNGFF